MPTTGDIIPVVNSALYHCHRREHHCNISVAPRAKPVAQATAALASFNIVHVTLNPIHYALYLFEDAKISLCYALFTLLAALSGSPRHVYVNRRSTFAAYKNIAAFGSDILRYEQHFAVK